MHREIFDVSPYHHRQSLGPIYLHNPNNGHEKSLKVDKRILRIMEAGGNNVFPSAKDFFQRIIEKTQVGIGFSSFKDRQGNEIPIVKVKSSNLKNLEAASALIMEYLDPHRDKMTFNIDVSHNDHSYIIGKDGSRIKLLSRETGCHIHLPDCNKTSGKKSNKLSIAGTTFQSIEQARNQIRKSLPLNIGFKAIIKSKKFGNIDTSCSEVQAIKRRYHVDVTFTNVNPSFQLYTEVTINVKGGRSQMDEIKSATNELYRFVTGEDISDNPSIDFTISIDVSHSHHQYVKGKNNCNLKVINQRSKAQISFPSNEAEDNIVLIQGKNLTHTVLGWQELMGYLPLLLSFDVNFDIHDMKEEIHRLEKLFGVGIRIREKLCGHVYTVLIKTQERHSICLQEIRQRILDLKTKFDKNNENFIQEDNVNPSIFGNYLNIFQGYRNNILNAKILNPIFCNYQNYSKYQADQVDFSSTLKYPPVTPLQSVDFPMLNQYNSAISNNYKYKGFNKRSPMNGPLYDTLNNITNDTESEGFGEFNTEMYSPTRSHLTSMPASPMSVDSIDPSTENSMLMSSKSNLDMNINKTFDHISSSQTNCAAFPKSEQEPKVDYSIGRYFYRSSIDSGISSLQCDTLSKKPTSSQFSMQDEPFFFNSLTQSNQY